MIEQEERERMEGYLDGLNPLTPEPSGNRSHSYRHGWTVGRADKEGQPAYGSASAARKASDEAESMDRKR